MIRPIHTTPSSALDVAGGTEDGFRFLQRARVHSSGESATAVLGLEIVGATQTREGVEEENHVTACLQETVATLQDDLRHPHVGLGALVR